MYFHLFRSVMVDEKIGDKIVTSFRSVVATENGEISEDEEDDR